MFNFDEIIVALLLFVGLYFPSSAGGEDSAVFFWLNRLVSLTLLLYLAWKHGTRPGAVTLISLPMVLFMGGCTLLNWPFRFQGSVFAAFSVVALLFSLDLKQVRCGRFARGCFVTANVLNLACGIAILGGNEWVGQLLSKSYSEFYPELVPAMLSLHKPVLTFANHSVAGFFIYLFFWLNWETYKRDRSKLALSFAVSELVLLVAVASFTSLTFSAVGLTQIGVWLWRRSRVGFAATLACVLTLIVIGWRMLDGQIGGAGEMQATVGATLNSSISGPLARYGAAGNVVNTTLNYIRQHPLSPIGFASPISTDVIDSGTLEYVLRGSIPLLFLVYFGLYRFLRHNLSSRVYIATLFLAIVAFETGFTALIYYRTACLLPFLVIWLNQVAPRPALSVQPSLIG